jgi:hypothetical protein
MGKPLMSGTSWSWFLISTTKVREILNFELKFKLKFIYFSTIGLLSFYSLLEGAITKSCSHLGQQRRSQQYKLKERNFRQRSKDEVVYLRHIFGNTLKTWNPHSYPPNKNLTWPLGCWLHHLISCAKFLFVIGFVTIFVLDSWHEQFPFLLSFWHRVAGRSCF